MVTPSCVHVIGASTLHDAYAYVPESVPSEQVRVCDTQEFPYGTVAAWYAVMDAPCKTVELLKVHERFTVTVREQVAVPPAPVAVPVYVMVADGYTVVPPETFGVTYPTTDI
jgi:hypothetical protein